MKLLQPRTIFLLIGIAVTVRLVSLGLYPLMDTTESRYGEMARLMVETGNWLTPQIDYGIPFWGKPPMHTWASALGYQFFGQNEFSLRLPHWIASIGTLLLVYLLAIRQGYNGLVAVLIVATCLVFSISSGAIMTDMLLTLSLTLALVSFYRAWHGSKIWGYGISVGIAMGLLVKGPLVIVLFGLTVFPWLLYNHGFVDGLKQLWQKIPLVSGILLMGVIAFPWYWMAEQATPGFLHYFIVGEHWSRFMESGWKGDLYGTAHDQPRGSIWLFWFISSLPWSVVLLALWAKRIRQALKKDAVIPAKSSVEDRHWHSFLFLWMLSPLILFTFSGNILVIYVLPGIPAIGLLVSYLIDGRSPGWLMPLSLMTPLLLVVLVIMLRSGLENDFSDRLFFSVADDQTPVFYWQKRTFSGRYYSLGQAKLVKSVDRLREMTRPFYLIGDQNQIGASIAIEAFDCALVQSSNKREKFFCGDGEKANPGSN